MRKKSKKFLWIILGMVILGAGGTWAYFQWYIPTTETANNEPTIQTASVRQGDLTVSASGTGTLVPAKEVSFGFKTSGEVAKINVSVGDTVKAGDVLATLDDTTAQKNYETARQTLLEMTSAKAIAEAHQALNDAQAALEEPVATLKWMLSPTLFYSEERLANTQQELQNIKDAAGPTPSAADQAKIKDAEIQVKLAHYNLVDAQKYYQQYRLIKWGETKMVGGRFRHMVYVTITDHTGETYYVINGPTDEEIAIARANYALVKTQIQEAQWYYDALLGKELPAGANSPALAQLAQARANLDNATLALSETELIAPTSGTIMSLDVTVGDKVTASNAVVTISDISTPYIDFYLDATDWDKAVVGNQAEVSFDSLPDQTFSGTVVEVDPSLVNQRGTYLVEGMVKLDPLPETLPVNMSVSVEVISAQISQAVLVPVIALIPDSSGQYSVYVMENGQPAQRTVEIGLQDSINAQVLSGLQVGDVVVTGNFPTQ